MRTGTARNGEIELYWIDEGDPAAPTVILVNGSGSTAVTWCRELIDPLLATGHRVVRFDNRDVGRSTRVPPGTPYEISDMAGDLAAVMDGLGIEHAALIGRSMGGMIAMQLATAAPERVDALVLIYSSPCMADPFEFGLPGPKRSILEAMAEAAAEDPADTVEERIARHIGQLLLLAGTRYEFDDAWARAEASADAAHAPEARPAHGMAVMSSDALVGVLDRIVAPTLIVHGTADPLIDVSHGRFLAEHIAAAELLELEGASHELPPAMCAEIIGRIMATL